MENMNRGFHGKWNGVTVARLLATGGMLAMSGCMSSHSSSEKSISQTESIAKVDMSLTQKQRPVLHAGKADFDQQVLRSDVPVLVDFYADWCGPCQRLAPVLDELAAETSNAKIVKVNIERSPELAATYGVDSIPSLKVFKNGQVTGQVVGLASKDRLRTMLTR
jgi:thioredoxin 1